MKPLAGIVLLVASTTWASDPLLRVQPQEHVIEFSNSYQTRHGFNTCEPGTVRLAMPVAAESMFCDLDRNSMAGRLLGNHVADSAFPGRCDMSGGFPFYAQVASLPIPQLPQNIQVLEWGFEYRVRSWSSLLDDAAAAQVNWPREWTSDDNVQQGLAPQALIESDDPRVKQEIDRLLGESLRTTRPYFVAREIVAHCVDNMRIEPVGTRYDEYELIGMNVKGALASLETGYGSQHDLVCLSVGLLRAAGIPARPVTGIHNEVSEVWTDDPNRGLTDADRRTLIEELTGEPADPDSSPPPLPPNTCNGFNRGLRADVPLLLDVVRRAEFVTWAEFYLPDIGWIPFDPNLMRGWTGSREGRWPGFGSIEELNERVPIAYHITAPGEAADLATEREIQLGTHVPWAWGWEPARTRRILPNHQGVDVELD